MANSGYRSSVAAVALFFAGSLCTLGSGAMAAFVTPADFSPTVYGNTIEFDFVPSGSGTQHELHVLDNLATGFSDPSLKLDLVPPQTGGSAAFRPTNDEITGVVSSANMVGSITGITGDFYPNFGSAYGSSDASSYMLVLGVVPGVSFPALAWLFGSAIMGLSVIARRRNSSPVAGSA